MGKYKKLLGIYVQNAEDGLDSDSIDTVENVSFSDLDTNVKRAYLLQNTDLEQIGTSKYFDHSGNGFHALAGRPVNAAQFDSDAASPLANSDFFTFVTTITPIRSEVSSFTAWINFGSNHALGSTRIIFGKDSSNNRYFNIGPDKIAAKGSGWTESFTYKALEFDRWYHIAIISDGTGDLFFYVDGELYHRAVGIVLGNVNGINVIGGWSQNSDDFWDGYLYDVQVYETVLLTQEQIQLIRFGAQVTGIDYRWKLDEGDFTGSPNAADSVASNDLTAAGGLPVPILDTVLPDTLLVSNLRYLKNKDRRLLSFNTTVDLSRVPDIELWLDAKRTDLVNTNANSEVAQIDDRSNQGNDATQDTDADKPHYGVNLLNSQQTLRFNDSEFLTIPYSSGLNPIEFTIFIVARSTTLETNQGLFSTSQTTNKGGFVLRIGTSNNISIWLSKTDDSTLNLSSTNTPIVDQWYLIAATYKSPDIELFVDGNSEDKASLTGLDYPTNNDPKVGTFYVDSTSLLDLTGDIAELVLVARKIEPAEFYAIQQYLNRSWFPANALPHLLDIGNARANESPIDYNDLELWLSALDVNGITLSGTKVTSWTDRSGNSNDATQSTDTNRPTYGSAQYNGHNVVTFDGVDNFLTCATAGNFDSANGFTAMILLKVNAPSTLQDIIRNRGLGALGTADGIAIEITSADKYQIIHEEATAYVSVDARGTVPNGTWYWLTVTMAASNIEVYEDETNEGVSVNDNGPVGTVATANQLHIGCEPGQTRFLDADVAEILLFKNVISEANLTAIRAERNAAWAVSGQDFAPRSYDDFTVAFGIVTEDTEADRIVVSRNNADMKAEIVLDEGYLIYKHDTETNIKSVVKINDGELHSVVLVNDGATQTMQMYIDGKSQFPSALDSTIDNGKQFRPDRWGGVAAGSISSVKLGPINLYSDAKDAAWVTKYDGFVQSGGINTAGGSGSASNLLQSQTFRFRTDVSAPTTDNTVGTIMPLTCQTAVVSDWDWTSQTTFHEIVWPDDGEMINFRVILENAPTGAANGYQFYWQDLDNKKLSGVAELKGTTKTVVVPYGFKLAAGVRYVLQVRVIGAPAATGFVHIEMEYLSNTANRKVFLGKSGVKTGGPDATQTHYLYANNHLSDSLTDHWVTNNDLKYNIWPVKGTIRNIYYTQNGNTPGASKQWDYTLLNRETSPTGDISMTVTDAEFSGGIGLQSNTSDTMAVSPGDRIQWKAVPTGTPATRHCGLSFCFDPDDASENAIIGGSADALNNTSTEFSYIDSSVHGSWGAPENNYYVEIKKKVRWKELRLHSTGTVDAGETFTVSVRVNPAGAGGWFDSALSAIITNADATPTNLTDVLDLNEGDRVVIKCLPSGANTSTVRLISWSIVEIPHPDTVALPNIVRRLVRGAQTDTGFTIVAELNQARTDVQLIVATDAAFTNVVYTGGQTPSSTTTFDEGNREIIRFSASGLTADTTYYATLKSAGQLDLDSVLTLKTFITPKVAPSGSKTYKIIPISCQDPNENSSPINTFPLYHGIFDAAPDLCLHVGDLTYADITADDKPLNRSSFWDAIANCEMQRVCRIAPFAFIYDDHEVGGGDGGIEKVGAEEYLANAIEAYKELLPLYSLSQPEGTSWIRGCAQEFWLGRQHFLIADMEFQRHTDTKLLGDGSLYTGVDMADFTSWDQTQWIYDQLEQAKTDGAIRSNLILSSRSPLCNGGGSWNQRYASERDAFLQALVALDAAEIRWISGDVHSSGIDDGTNGVQPYLVASEDGKFAMMDSSPISGISDLGQTTCAWGSNREIRTYLPILKADYDFVQSTAAPNEYYIDIEGGGDPNFPFGTIISSNQFQMVVRMSGSSKARGTIGSLSAGQWDYGDNDSRGYDTFIVRLTDSTDPTTKGDGHVALQWREALIHINDTDDPANIHIDSTYDIKNREGATIIAQGTSADVANTLSWNDAAPSANDDAGNVTVRIDKSGIGPAKVTLTTVDGSAMAPTDYTAINGVEYTIPANSTYLEVNIPIFDVVGGDKSFFVDMSAAVNGTISSARATVTITDLGVSTTIAVTLPTKLRDVYIDKAATGANDGTSWTDAYQTIAAAIGNLLAGDYVYIKTGTYQESELDFIDDGGSSNEIVWQPDSGLVTIQNTSSSSSGAMKINGTYQIFDGGVNNEIVFESPNMPSGQACVKCYGANGVVRRSAVQNPGASVGVIIAASQFRFYNNEVKDSSSHGIYVQNQTGQTYNTDDLQIRGNTIHDCDFAGIQFYPHATDHASWGFVEGDTIIAANHIYKCGRGAQQRSAIEVWANEVSGFPNKSHKLRDNLYIVNNLIEDCYSGVKCQHWLNTTIFVLNNTIYNTDAYAVWVGPGANVGDHLYIENNLMWDLLIKAIQIQTTTTNTQTTNITVNPSFLSTVRGNANFLKINSGSAAYNVGTDIGAGGSGRWPTAISETDYFATSRPQNTTWDVGAHEAV